MKFLRMVDLDLKGKRVLVRVDFNVPFQDGLITEDTRIRAALPGIRHALGKGARLMLVSHLGRPTEGKFEEAESLAPVAKHLSRLLGVDVPLVHDWIGAGSESRRFDPMGVEPGKVVMLENCRFNVGEKNDDEALSKKIAALCDIYVNDAFGTAHRAEATTHGVARFAPLACAGPLLAAELDALGKALAHPARPLVAIVAGSKVSTKLTILAELATKVDQLIVGGGIANTFLLAAGSRIGKSLAEHDLTGEASKVMATLMAKGGGVPLPIDVVCAKEFSATAKAETKAIRDVAPDDLILDIGPQSAAALAGIVGKAGTVVWNGPVGVFEFDAFGHGTETLAHAIADSKAYSIAGGGDTLAAIAKYGVTDRISYISTGGGAFLEFLEGKTLPAVAALEARAER